MTAVQFPEARFGSVIPSKEGIQGGCSFPAFARTSFTGMTFLFDAPPLAVGCFIDIRFLRDMAHTICYIAGEPSQGARIMTAGYKTQIAGILKAAARIEGRTRDLSREGFLRDLTAVSAVEEDLARIGKAVGDLPAKIRQRYPGIDWAAWSGIVSPGGDALWSVVKQNLPAFARQVNRILLDITD
jgi:uncharacterized protein with HEPN domain